MPCGRPHPGPQRWALSNPLNLWINYLARVEGIKVAERIKVANQVILRLGDCLRLSGWAQCNHKGPSNREERSIRAHVRVTQREKDWTGYRRKATTSWGVWAALDAGKGNESDFPQSLRKGTWHRWHLSFGSGKLILDSDLQNCKRTHLRYFRPPSMW